MCFCAQEFNKKMPQLEFTKLMRMSSKTSFLPREERSLGSFSIFIGENTQLRRAEYVANKKSVINTLFH
jgi:hypothetical protein